MELASAELYKNISRLICDQNYNDLIKECKKVGNEDEYVTRVKAIALIKQKRFKEALKMCFNDMEFEKAYCYYRMKDYENSKRLLSNKQDYSSLNQLAQICYNEGNYEEAINYYRINKGEQKCSTWMKNVSACSASYANVQTISPGKKDDMMKKCTALTTANSDDFDVFLNYSLYHTYMHNWEEGKKFLDIAKSSFEKYKKAENLSENEAAVEKVLINLQSFYIYFKTGNISSARNIMNEEILPYVKSYDYYSQVITLSNNLILMKRRSVNESKRKLGPINTALPRVKGLLDWQRKDIQYNLFILYFFANYLTICINMIDKNEREGSVFDCVHDMKARYLMDGKMKYRGLVDKIINDSDETFKCNSDEFITQKLICAQIYKEKGDYESVIAILIEVLKIRPNEIILLLLVKAFKHQFRHDEAFNMMTDYLEKNVIFETDNLESFIEDYFTLALYLGKFKESLETVKRTSWIDKNISDTFVRCGGSLCDIQDFMVESSTLNSCIAKVDDVINRIGSSRRNKSDVKQKKRRRKRRLSKKYNPNFIPDSERWLPKFERSNYIPKKKKKSTKSKGSQGAAVSATAEYSTYTTDPEDSPVKNNNVRKGRGIYNRKKGRTRN